MSLSPYISVECYQSSLFLLVTIFITSLHIIALFLFSTTALPDLSSALLSSWIWWGQRLVRFFQCIHQVCVMYSLVNIVALIVILASCYSFVYLIHNREFLDVLISMALVRRSNAVSSCLDYSFSYVCAALFSLSHVLSYAEGLFIGATFCSWANVLLKLDIILSQLYATRSHASLFRILSCLQS